MRKKNRRKRGFSNFKKYFSKRNHSLNRSKTSLGKSKECRMPTLLMQPNNYMNLNVEAFPLLEMRT